VSISTLPPVHFDVIPGAKPTRIPPHHRSQEEEQMIEEEVQRFIKKGWVEPGMSPWSSPFAVAKGKNGRYDRVVVDCTGLNSVLKKVDCVLPTAEDILSRHEGNC